MSSSSAPFGLRPALHPSGVIRPQQGAIESAYATNIYQGYPVAIDANGFVTAAAAGARAVGAFQGVEYTDVNGIRRYNNRWVANTVATDVVAWFTQDSYIEYEIQANATLTRAAIGQQYDWSALAGNSVTGLASVSLDVASADANAGLQVVGLNPGPDNEWGDAFPVVLVRISEHQFVADVASF